MDDDRGFVLINGLIIMLILSSFILSSTYVANRYLLVLKDYQTLYERLELEHIVIKRINNEFYEYENSDFALDLFESHIMVTYEDLVAEITVAGKHNFSACLVYNDPYGTIESYEYRDDCLLSDN